MCFESGTICLQSNTVSEYIYVLLISLDQKPIVKFVWPNCTYMMYIHLTHFIRSTGGVALQYSPTPRSVNSSSGKAESFSFLHILHENNILLHVYVYTYMYMYIYMYSTAETEVHVR